MGQQRDTVHCQAKEKDGGMSIYEGRKDDNGKLRFDLLPPDALHELVRVYTQGAVKYDPRNWERGITFGRVFAALMRHLWAWWGGEEKIGRASCRERV